jgi:protein-tyrosine-phosphatase
MTNILFICKYNRFRSRVACSYFNKINRNKRNKAKSAGIIVGGEDLNPLQVKAAMELGINIRGKPSPVTTEKLIWEDIIVIVADNVPPEIFKFNEARFQKKTIVWKIPDIRPGDGKKEIVKIIHLIIKKVDELIKKLK